MVSKGLVWKPDAATPAETSKKLGGPCEITSMALKSGTPAAYVALYDGTSLSDAIPANLRWVLDASVPGNDNEDFNDALVFYKGLFAVLEQGAGGNAALCVAARQYTNNPTT